jgi:hypothetical protein
MQEIEHRGFMVVGLCGFICGMPMCSRMCTCGCVQTCVCSKSVCMWHAYVRLCMWHACLSRGKEGNEGNSLLWPSPASPPPVALATAPRRPRHCPKRPSPATMPVGS